MGVKRIILSRELSIAEIQEIHMRVPCIQMESFVHGAICIAWSGRCLLSNYFNHRDANQGTCTNSCRWEYNVYKDAAIDKSVSASKEAEENFYIEEVNRLGELLPIEEDEHGTYIMNSKDLRAIEFLRELSGAGVSSLKIEGRSKSIYYLGIVTRAYRKAVDDLALNRAFDPVLLGELDKTSNRGFTSAFLVSSGTETERFGSTQEYALPQVYAGQIKGHRQERWMEVDVKNRIEVGDEVEYISPRTQYRFRITAMEDSSGAKVSIAHGGNGPVWVYTDRPIEPFALSLIQPAFIGKTSAVPTR